jgi:hypothetical protein
LLNYMNNTVNFSIPQETINVIAGVPIYRQGAYILHKFLANQNEIQREYPSCELVLATNEAGFCNELSELLHSYKLRGRVIPYRTVKPDYAKSWVWNVAFGREAIRQHILFQTQAKYYLSMDADMLYEPAVVGIMETMIHGCDIVISGYPLRDFGVGLIGGGCMMINRNTLEKVPFRCVEFKNGDTLSEDYMFEMDSFRLGCRIKKGFFVHVSHYKSENQVEHIAPQPVSMYRRLTTSALFRYLLIRCSLMVGHNIPRRLWRMKWRANRSICRFIHLKAKDFS